MSGGEAALRRDRLIILAALLLLVAVAWAYLFRLAAGMAMPPEAAQMPGMNMSMPGMDMGAAMAPSVTRFDLTDALLTFIMWFVMMIGMMTPAVTPTILLYARVGRMAALQQKPFAPAGWFAGGYFLAWAAFSLAATAAQIGLRDVMLLTAMLQSSSDLLSGFVLVVAGLYQWSPWKNACLEHCRAPLLFIQRHGGFRPQAGASVMLGLRHGLYCIGCCWALMLLLFVGGVMNIAWIAGLAVLVLAEKLWSRGRHLSRAVGVAAIAGGLFLIIRYFGVW
jgi:predicted metal-binding membrane protein